MNLYWHPKINRMANIHFTMNEKRIPRLCINKMIFLCGICWILKKRKCLCSNVCAAYIDSAHIYIPFCLSMCVCFSTKERCGHNDPFVSP
mmetsp:Transcript_29301/g.44318  ORF Transcript_29301/g.44318 Transcript_29301/m.44318 type:complete len:90 (+) Transcript_29301:1580-1849(+)